VLCYSEEHYDTIFTAGGRHDLLGDERYASGPARIAHSTFLYREVASVLRTRTTEQWLAFCREHSIPATAVADLDDLVDALPDAEHPVTGRYKTIPHPVRFSHHPASVRRPAPLVGQHTDEVLREVGLSESEIARLQAEGAIGRRTLPA
jgi:crotonobetainyl-CoA:carnitine CoA-transferase CaiB-like acyl-CoA transferase